VLAERASRFDDVGDRVGNPELHGDLHRPVQPDDRGGDAVVRQVGAHQVGVGGGHPPAREIRDVPVVIGRRRVAEGGVTESQTDDLLHRGAGISRQVTAGDSQVELAGPDIDRDVLGAQEEELDVVGDVDHRQVTRLVPLAIARLPQHLGGGLAERALVRHGDSQHRQFSLR